MEKVKQLISDYLPALIELLRNMEYRAQNDLKMGKNAVLVYLLARLVSLVIEWVRVTVFGVILGCVIWKWVDNQAICLSMASFLFLCYVSLVHTTNPTLVAYSFEH